MQQHNNITILSVETSCDDTCIAAVSASGKTKPCFKILSNIVSSQIEIHKKWGGVYPTLAKREHQKNLVPVLKKALKGAKLLKTQSAKFKAQKYNLKLKTLEKILSREEYLYEKLERFLEKYQKPKIDAISVTVGPGLEPCLWVGVNFAKALSYWWNLPIIPINHIEAHILANFINKFQISIATLRGVSRYARSSKFQDLFPVIALVVSGGHTQLILMRSFGNYKIIGETRDDAAGECFDKTARILGLEYPGGPAIAAEAAKIKNQKLKIKNKLPRPMIKQKNYDFSFSGLKTAVLYNYKSQPRKTKKSEQYIKEMCYEVQQAIIDVLIKKTIKAAKNYKAKTIFLGGGVAANKELRKQFKEKIKKEIPTAEYLIPDTKYCTDNAVMIAITGYFRWRNGKIENWKDIKADANLRIE